MVKNWKIKDFLAIFCLFVVSFRTYLNKTLHFCIWPENSTHIQLTSEQPTQNHLTGCYGSFIFTTCNELLHFLTRLYSVPCEPEPIMLQTDVRGELYIQLITLHNEIIGGRTVTISLYERVSLCQSCPELLFETKQRSKVNSNFTLEKSQRVGWRGWICLCRHDECERKKIQ